MKNKIKFQIFLIFFYLTSIVNLNAEEQFVFDVTEIEITENGNIFKGYNRGKISVSNGIEIDANKFKYNKLKNVLYASGDVNQWYS